MHAIERRIGYSFKDSKYLRIALTHSSYANENKEAGSHNERQEFLGDAVLSIVVSDYIFRHLNVPEGELTKIRASLVCEGALAEFARQIDLGDALYLGHGEEHNGGRTRPSILADAFEALIAAIYLDGGIEEARKFVLPFIMKQAEHASGTDLHDYKTQLQEIVQKNRGEILSYEIVEESGPAHDKNFVCHVKINSNVLAEGSGHSKKKAEQAAARAALELMGIR